MPGLMPSVEKIYIEEILRAEKCTTGESAIIYLSKILVTDIER